MTNTLNLFVANAVFFIGLGISSKAIDSLSWQRQATAVLGAILMVYGIAISGAR